MIQSGGILANLIAAVPQVMFHTGVQAFKKAASELAEQQENTMLIKPQALLNNETKNIKVIRSFKNRGILLKGTTKEIVVNKEYFSTFLAC